MNLYDVSIPLYRKMLLNLDAWLTESADVLKGRGVDPETLTTARLAPDMYTLVQQVQSACDAAKFGAVYVSGIKAPAHPDTETTLEQLHARIRSCVEFLDSVPRDVYAGAEDRMISPPWLKGAKLKSGDYLLQASIPNFLFHVTTAYGIMRHSGALLGKSKFIGELPLITS